jgi:methyl-accepting chemotaxis protein
MSGNGGDLQDTSSLNGNPINLERAVAAATNNAPFPTTTTTGTGGENLPTEGSDPFTLVEAIVEASKTPGKTIDNVVKTIRHLAQGQDGETTEKDLDIAVDDIFNGEGSQFAMMMSFMQSMQTTLLNVEAKVNRIEAVEARLEAVETKVNRIEAVEARLEAVEAKVDRIEETIEEKIEQKWNSCSETWVKNRIKEIDVKMADIDGKMKQYAETFLK